TREEVAEVALEAPAVAEETRDPGAAELVVDGDGNNELDFDRLEALSKDWSEHFNEEHRPSRNGLDEEGDKKHDAMQNMASRPQSLQDYLYDQIAFLEASAQQVSFVRYLISNIDENGRLITPLEELTQSFDEPITLAQAEEALHLLQKLDPPGVGARDTRECLLLQLAPETPHRDAVRTLILNHLEDIQHNRLPAIQKR